MSGNTRSRSEQRRLLGGRTLSRRAQPTVLESRVRGYRVIRIKVASNDGRRAARGVVGCGSAVTDVGDFERAVQFLVDFHSLSPLLCCANQRTGYAS